MHAYIGSLRYRSSTSIAETVRRKQTTETMQCGPVTIQGFFYGFFYVVDIDLLRALRAYTYVRVRCFLTKPMPHQLSPMYQRTHHPVLLRYVGRFSTNPRGMTPRCAGYGPRSHTVRTPCRSARFTTSARIAQMPLSLPATSDPLPAVL